MPLRVITLKAGEFSKSHNYLGLIVGVAGISTIILTKY
jgi:hypothetical protein